jgi:hypothetical protein
MSKPSPANRQVYLLIVVLITGAALTFGYLADDSRLSPAPEASLGNILVNIGSTKTINLPPPSYFEGTITSPEEFATTSSEFISLPLFGEYALNWYANDSFRNTYYSDCELRWDGKRLAGAGYEGSSTIKASQLMESKSRPDKYGLPVYFYCRPKNDTRINPVDLRVETGLSKLEVAVNNCEASFDGILYGFANSTVFPVRITEDSFKEWASGDSFDHCEYGLTDDGFACAQPTDVKSGSSRSGDREDIKKAMFRGQCDLIDLVDNDWFSYFGPLALDEIMPLTNLKRPAPFTIYFPPDEGRYGPSHSLIALNITKTTTSGLEYQVEYLDSMGPTVGQMSCSSYDPPIIVPVYLPDGTEKDTKIRFACDYPFEGSSLLAIPYPDKGTLLLAKNLNQRFSTKCPTNISNPNELEICRRKANMSGWLKSNYPDISNFAGPPGSGTETGVCGGWTTFVLQATYLAQFEGECLHQ